MTQGRSEEPGRPLSFLRDFYARFGSWIWLVAMLLTLLAIWQMDEPSGVGQSVYGRVQAAEARSNDVTRLTVDIADTDTRATVDSRTPYRPGDRVKLRKRTTLIFKRTVYELSGERP